MNRSLSAHLPSAIILLAAVTIAAVADRAARAGAGRRGASGSAAPTLPAFLTPAPVDSAGRNPDVALTVDPFSGERPLPSKVGVARAVNAPTVRPADAQRRLTALLIADDRRVAVVDDSLVTVGDVLSDGSRVSAIQPDGVWIIEKNGKWRLLTVSRAGR